MSDGIKITELPVNNLPYLGSEQFPIVQANETRVSTLSSLVTYLSGALLADSELNALSGNWQSTYTTTNANSANWQSTYTTTNANSANWQSTYTTVNILSVAIVTNLNANRIFTDTDTNKIFHFDTTSAPLTASFPGLLSDGFNAGIMNTGTNYLYISSNIQYNAVGNKLIDRYSGAYVYKSNSQIFAVGGV